LYSGVQVERATREYLNGIARDLSLGGLFLESRRPLPKGTLVDLDFFTETNEGQEPVHARAVVRWVRRFFRPRGMGLEFVDVEGLGSTRLEHWIESVLV
jgi:hypothetical protein